MGLSTFGVRVIIEAYLVLVEEVAINHRGMRQVLCLSALHCVVFWAKVDELVVVFPFLSLDLVTGDFIEPTSRESPYNCCEVVFVLFLLFMRGLKVYKSVDFIVDDHNHLVWSAVFVGCMLWELLNIGTEPSHISGGPFALGDLLIEILLGALNDTIDPLSLFIGSVQRHNDVIIFFEKRQLIDSLSQLNYSRISSSYLGGK